MASDLWPISGKNKNKTATTIGVGIRLRRTPEFWPLLVHVVRVDRVVQVVQVVLVLRWAHHTHVGGSLIDGSRCVNGVQPAQESLGSAEDGKDMGIFHIIGLLAFAGWPIILLGLYHGGSMIPPAGPKPNPPPTQNNSHQLIVA
jgi:hypothetical protein